MSIKPNNNNHITTDFIETLRIEGNKAWNTCLSLNADLKFKEGIKSFTDSEFTSTQYNAQHLLLRDLVNVYNTYTSLFNKTSEIPVKVKFTLIFLYEKLQGKDLSESFNVQKLQKLHLSNHFDKNIALIQSTSFFQPSEKLKTEFASILVLTKIKSKALATISSFLNRVALLMAQADGNILKEEESILKGLSNKINSPKIQIDSSNYQEVPEDDTLEKVMEELNNLIGLDAIKKNVEDLTNFLKVQKFRETERLKITHNALHTVFMGPPGTGKTTVARLLGRIFKHLGYLKRGHLVETDRSGMVAGYVGQTAIKADEIIAAAADGVLFIDEAYSLTNGGMNDFGKEAIEVLLKRMEDSRKNLVVIVAGYPDEMEVFIQSNPGLQSRFNRYFTFDHYNEKALLEIFKIYAKNADFKLTEEAEDKLSEIIHGLCQKRQKGFGNARTMRNLFEKIIERQANRIVGLEVLTKDVLITLVEEDIPEIKKTIKEILIFNEN